ncbi:MAG: hypothetical protein LC098_04090 [Burkholderiales bacterium]|nr:hypothetical protein [Burkholderiales bacterium]
MTLLRNARAGDVDAIASVRTAQAELAEARAENATVDQYGRFVVRDDNGLAIGVTQSAGDALQAARKRGADGTVIIDRDSADSAPVGVVRRSENGAVMEGYDPAFEAAANAELNERGSRRSTPGVFTKFEREPEQTLVGFEERTGQRNELVRAVPAAEPAGQVSELERVARQQRAVAYPEGFDRRYLVVGDRVVDARQHERLLMIDKTSRLEATREFDSETVRLMVETAKARGWGEVAVRGSAEFRKAVWTAAITQGIEVKGYAATADEKAWADRQREAATAKAEALKATASAFVSARTPEDRTAAAEKHPELVKAFALDAAVSSFAKRIQNQAGRDAFTARVRQHITEDLHAGRPIAEIRVRQSMNDELRRQQQERQPERDR